MSFEIPYGFLLTDCQSYCTRVADGTHETPTQAEIGKKLATSKNIKDGRLTLENSYLIPEDEFVEINKRSKVDQWDILISMIGTVGEVCLIDVSEPDFAIKNVGLLKCGDQCKAKWLYYYLRSPLAKRLIEARKKGTTQQYISLGEIRRFPVIYPETYSHMSNIVSLLSSLDDRITLLRETNATLEAIAQALFKSWFVDFDPVHAKQKGSAPEGMDEATAALFPDSFEESELGLVPKGWRVASVGNVSEQIFSGGTPDTRKPEYWLGDIPWFSSGETRNRFVIDTERKINRLAVENSSTKLSLPGDVLIASAGQGHTRGQTSYNTLKTYINQSVVAVRANQGECDPLWLYYNLSRRYDEMRNLSDSHSSRGSLTTKLLAGMCVTVPSRVVGRAFANLADLLMEAQVINEQQALTLAALRDTLLPRLISGQLRLPEAEALITECA